MSPLDDELRAALHGRATALAPSPDPLAGIERRAKRLQRNRIGAAVAGSALAVAAIAAVVPALQSATSSQPDVPRFGSPAATEDHTTDTSKYALDPMSPWEYRGVPQDQLGTGTLATIEREYATKRGAPVDDFTPLFARVDSETGRAVVVFLATVGDSPRWAVAVTEEGPSFPVDEQLLAPAFALAATLPAQDGTPQLLVVAAPDVAGINYRPERGAGVSAMQELERGVSLVNVQPAATTDAYVVVDPQGRTLVEADAPDLGTSGQPAVALNPAQPWEVRGDRSLVTDGQLKALGEDWAQRHGVDPTAVEVQPLYVQRSQISADTEVVYLVRFGDNPWMWGVSTLGEGGWSWYADNELSPGTPALAAALPGDEGRERLLIVATPSAGGAVYAADGRSYEPMSDLAPGVFLTSISPGDADDRVKVLDGDGDLDRPMFEGPAPDFQNAG